MLTTKHAFRVDDRQRKRDCLAAMKLVMSCLSIYWGTCHFPHLGERAILAFGDSAASPFAGDIRIIDFALATRPNA